jgi:hypothetical protein
MSLSISAIYSLQECFEPSLPHPESSNPDAAVGADGALTRSNCRATAEAIFIWPVNI